MSARALITGGAGFIGSHVADELLRRGFRVRALDVLCPQIHGNEERRPAHLAPDVELIVGDVRNPEIVKRALQGVDVAYHFAARVGVGQSMYEIEQYISANAVGTAVLLQCLIEQPVERLVVASSMSVYGEGLYRDRAGRLVEGSTRSLEQLKRAKWELADSAGQTLTPVPTPESKTPSCDSVYALSKWDQERLCLIVGRAYGIPTVALRFFNVYGPRQALSNPYTGVLAIFAARIMNQRPPLIFEDGLQRRDFVSVHDVARACAAALDAPAAHGKALNIGSGKAFTIQEIAERVRAAIGSRAPAAELTGKYRMGDVRHCFADVSAAKVALGHEPSVSIEQGLTELAGWLEGKIAGDHFGQARAELEPGGLTL